MEQIRVEPAQENNEQEHQFLASRVRSFASDPLHSAAYLSNLVTYMNKPFQKQWKNRRNPLTENTSNQPYTTFLYSYEISGTRPSKPAAFNKVSAFLSHNALNPVASTKSELVFLTGYPSSPEWLNAIVSRYGVDHRFLQRHLDFLPSGQRDWYTAPDVPSRSENFIQLVIPSIVFIGSEDRYVSVTDLQKARNACSDQLRQKSKSFFGGSGSSICHSIIRHINIHSGDAIVMEQNVTITVLRHGGIIKGAIYRLTYCCSANCLIVLVWTDSGSDLNSNYVTIPNVDSFKNVSNEISFCPVFFENELQERNSSSSTSSAASHGKQPLSILPGRYGETINWSGLSADPILVLRELFNFQSAAAIQYLNMLRKNVSQLVIRNQSIDITRSVNMEDILHFDYAKTVLVRWAAHFKRVIQALDTGPLRHIDAPQGAQEERKKMLLSLQVDLEFLHNEAKTIIELCDNGKSTILSNFSISESKRTSEEAKLVTELTKTTNRLTFIFLPISFVTSVFGMNFRQFGQGPLSISLWVVVTIPLLLVSIILVEWGRLITTYFRRFF